MLIYPKFDPIAFSLGPIKVHWYGLMYLVGFAAAWLLALSRAKKPYWNWTTSQVSDLIFYAALGVILGGRIGYIIFYNLPYYYHHPLQMLEVWDGGMSFHGGMLGVVVAMWLYSYKMKCSVWDLTDFAAPLVPIGLACGRLGNFINGELWGRVTNVPWAMVFPHAGPLPRHPSQLYEFALEGVALFILLWVFSRKQRPRFAVSAMFLTGYGIFRFFCEFFRQPDPQYGFLLWGWVTMGQILSAPMIVGGIYALIWIYWVRKDTC